MIDREKVIKGLQIERECVSRDCDRDCGKCDLAQDRDWLLSVYDDALELLKKQEPKLAESIRDRSFLTSYRCPSCGVQLHRFTGDDRTRYCGRCGQAVKWDD